MIQSSGLTFLASADRMERRPPKKRKIEFGAVGPAPFRSIGTNRVAVRLIGGLYDAKMQSANQIKSVYLHTYTHTHSHTRRETDRKSKSKRDNFVAEPKCRYTRGT